MALNIKNPEAERLVVEVARLTGETRTRAVIVALRERLGRLSGRRHPPNLTETLAAISARCSALPDLDTSPPDEILGYDERGTFGS